MYPRNSASPERIAIGPVVQISDGAVQTSGCTVRVLESGGTEGDGGGTTAYSTDGVVLYTPLQAETDQASFVLIAKKSGCIPASVTVITSASATAGTVFLAPVTHTSAVIPTVTTTTTATNLTNAPTNGDLTATMKTSVTTAATAATPTAAAVTGAVGSVTGNVSGSIGSLATQAKADVNAEVDTAFADYDPPTNAELEARTLVAASYFDPATDGVNVTSISGDSTAADRLEAVLDAMPTGLVVDDNDPDPLATAFETNLAEATNDHYNGAFLVFSSGALLGQSRKILDYDGTAKVITLAAAFTEAPAGGDAFLIVGRSE